MTLKNKIYFVILALAGQLFFSGHVATEPLVGSDDALEQEIFLTAPVPEKDRLMLVSVVPIIAEGKILGGLAAYDDATTKRPADYLELYNNAGTLLAVGWFDRFGIERMAVDRALLEDADQLEGVFVLLLEGDSV